MTRAAELAGRLGGTPGVDAGLGGAVVVELAPPARGLLPLRCTAQFQPGPPAVVPGREPCHVDDGAPHQLGVGRPAAFLVLGEGRRGELWALGTSESKSGFPLVNPLQDRCRGVHDALVVTLSGFAESETEDGSEAAPIDPPVIHEDAKLTASQVATSDLFGWSVALSGDTALVGAPFDA